MAKTTHDGVDISYRVIGDGDRDLVLVHGWMVAGSVFDELIEKLDRDRWRIIVPDLRGAGDSGEAGSYELHDYAGDLEAVVDAAGADRFALVGHSMGGQITQIFAADHPHRVERLVLLSPVPLSGMELPEEAHGLFISSGEDRQKQAAIFETACLDLDESAKERLLDAAGCISEDCIQAAYRAWTGGGDVDKLSAIEAPTLVVASDDPFLPPEFLTSAIVELIDDAELTVIEGAGHYIPVERSGETARVIEEFLGGVSH